MRRLFALLLLAAPAFAADPAKDGFVPLFNGKDLTGWKNVNCGPKTWTVKDGTLVTSGTPIGLLRTEKQYENFEAEFDWMHVNTKETGNSGFFVWCDPLPQIGGPFTRGIEVQVLVNYPPNNWATNHGDVFSVSGAKCTPDRPHPTKKGLERCLPSEERCKGGGEWNHYKVVGKDGAIKLSVNGKEVSGVSECTPRKGYLSFESEGAECHFKNVKIKELPTSNPTKEQTADVDDGWTPLFNHTDLTGWAVVEKAWKVEGGTLNAAAGTEAIYNLKGDKAVEVIFDWTGPESLAVRKYRGDKENTFEGIDLKAKKAGNWQRERLPLEPPLAALGVAPGKGLKLRNVYVREVAEKK
jgi:hypothetical protein